MEIAAFNFVAAHTDGITYRSSMQVPDHGAPSDEKPHWTMLDGTDPSTLWTGKYLPPEKLPRQRSFDRGFVVTANNDPLGFTADGRFGDDPYYFGAFFDPGTRAYRIESEIVRLIRAGKLTSEQMERLQGDTHSVFADDMIPLLEDAERAVGVDPLLASYVGRTDLSDLVTQLSQWDRRMDRASSGAVAFNAFAFYLTQGAVEDEFGVTFGAIMAANQPALLRFGPLVLLGRFAGSEAYLSPSKHVIVLQALDATAKYLAKRFGGLEPSRYKWADVHGTRFDHVWPEGQSLGWRATDGGVGTVNVSDTSALSGSDVVDRFDATSGAIFRSVTHFEADGTPVARLNFPPGNTAEPASKHYRDTLDDWLENRRKKLLFDAAEIEAASAERFELSR